MSYDSCYSSAYDDVYETPRRASRSEDAKQARQVMEGIEYLMNGEGVAKMGICENTRNSFMSVPEEEEEAVEELGKSLKCDDFSTDLKVKKLKKEKAEKKAAAEANQNGEEAARQKAKLDGIEKKREAGGDNVEVVEGAAEETSIRDMKAKKLETARAEALSQAKDLIRGQLFNGTEGLDEEAILSEFCKYERAKVSEYIDQEGNFNSEGWLEAAQAVIADAEVIDGMDILREELLERAANKPRVLKTLDGNSDNFPMGNIAGTAFGTPPAGAPVSAPSELDHLAPMQGAALLTPSDEYIDQFDQEDIIKGIWGDEGDENGEGSAKVAELSTKGEEFLAKRVVGEYPVTEADFNENGSFSADKYVARLRQEAEDGSGIEGVREGFNEKLEQFNTAEKNAAINSSINKVVEDEALQEEVIEELYGAQRPDGLDPKKVMEWAVEYKPIEEGDLVQKNGEWVLNTEKYKGKLKKFLTEDVSDDGKKVIRAKINSNAKPDISVVGTSNSAGGVNPSGGNSGMAGAPVTSTPTATSAAGSSAGASAQTTDPTATVSSSGVNSATVLGVVEDHEPQVSQALEDRNLQWKIYKKLYVKSNSKADRTKGKKAFRELPGEDRKALAKAFFEATGGLSKDQTYDSKKAKQGRVKKKPGHFKARFKMDAASKARIANYVQKRVNGTASAPAANHTVIAPGQSSTPQVAQAQFNHAEAMAFQNDVYKEADNLLNKLIARQSPDTVTKLRAYFYDSQNGAQRREVLFSRYGLNPAAIEKYRTGVKDLKTQEKWEPKDVAATLWKGNPDKPGTGIGDLLEESFKDPSKIEQLTKGVDQMAQINENLKDEGYVELLQEINQGMSELVGDNGEPKDKDKRLRVLGEALQGLPLPEWPQEGKSVKEIASDYLSLVAQKMDDWKETDPETGEAVEDGLKGVGGLKQWVSNKVEELNEAEHNHEEHSEKGFWQKVGSYFLDALIYVAKGAGSLSVDLTKTAFSSTLEMVKSPGVASQLLNQPPRRERDYV